MLPGNEDLTLAEVKLLQEIGREMKLKKALAPVAGLVRLHPDRLPAFNQYADRQRIDRGRWVC